jgi:hypothetical protein
MKLHVFGTPLAVTIGPTPHRILKESSAGREFGKFFFMQLSTQKTLGFGSQQNSLFDREPGYVIEKAELYKTYGFSS